MREGVTFQTRFAIATNDANAGLWPLQRIRESADKAALQYLNDTTYYYIYFTGDFCFLDPFYLPLHKNHL